jgi:hypothetical protein
MIRTVRQLLKFYVWDMHRSSIRTIEFRSETLHSHSISFFGLSDPEMYNYLEGNIQH